MERQPRSERPAAGPGRKYIGHWPDLATYGQVLAEDVGLADYVWEIPKVLRPYVQLDYAAIVRDMHELGGLDLVEAPDGVHVYEIESR